MLRLLKKRSAVHRHCIIYENASFIKIGFIYTCNMTRMRWVHDAIFWHLNLLQNLSHCYDAAQIL